MKTLNQVKAGTINYIDSEILPHLSGAKRYGTLVYLALVAGDVERKVHDVLRQPAIAILGLTDENDNVDLDRVRSALSTAMQKCGGKLDVDIPVVGRFAFSQSDIDKLIQMIEVVA